MYQLKKSLYIDSVHFLPAICQILCSCMHCCHMCCLWLYMSHSKSSVSCGCTVRKFCPPPPTETSSTDVHKGCNTLAICHSSSSTVISLLESEEKLEYVGTCNISLFCYKTAWLSTKNIPGCHILYVPFEQ